MKVIMEARQLGGQLASQVGSDILVFPGRRNSWQSVCGFKMHQPISLNVSPSVWKSYISGFSNVLAKILSCNAKVVGCYLLL